MGPSREKKALGLLPSSLPGSVCHAWSFLPVVCQEGANTFPTTQMIKEGRESTLSQCPKRTPDSSFVVKGVGDDLKLKRETDWSLSESYLYKELVYVFSGLTPVPIPG